MRFLSHYLNSTKRFRHLTQCNQQFALITILKNAVQQLKSVGRVVSIYLCHCFLVQSISHSPISFSNLSSTHKHARYLQLVFAYLHRITVKLFFYLQSRNKLDILRLYRYEVPTRYHDKTYDHRSYLARFCSRADLPQFLRSRRATCIASLGICLYHRQPGNGGFHTCLIFFYKLIFVNAQNYVVKAPPDVSSTFCFFRASLWLFSCSPWERRGEKQALNTPLESRALRHFLRSASWPLSNARPPCPGYGWLRCTDARHNSI